MEKVYFYEEVKDDMKNVKDFFENLDLSSLSQTELKTIDWLKDIWADYYMKYVCIDPPIDITRETVEIFMVSKSIKDENTRLLLLDFAYDYIDSMRCDDIFSFSEKEETDELLDSIGLVGIHKYFEMKRNFETLNNLKQKKKTLY